MAQTPVRPVHAPPAVPEPAAQLPPLGAVTHAVTPGDPTLGDQAPSTAADLAIDPAALQPGMLIGQYRIESKLGEGGMGAVWKATHLQLEKPVALKILPPQLLRDAGLVSRFDREIKAVGRLDHPHLVRAYDAGEFQGTRYLVMECIDGVDLLKYVRERGVLSVADAVRFLSQAAEGLAEAHAAGLVHRDIKPGNLMVTRKGVVKVMDLGLARLHNEGEEVTNGTLTTAGQILGTPDYMAPEQWDDTHSVDARCDLYALGCTLFFLLTGKAPFGEHKSTIQKMKAHGTLAPPDLRAARAEAVHAPATAVADPSATLAIGAAALPDDLVMIYERLLAKNPDDRYASAGELSEALKTLLPAPATVSVTQMEMARPFATLDLGDSDGLRRAAGDRKSRAVLRTVLMGFSALILLAAIIIVIRKRDGSTVKIPLEKGDKVEIVEQDDGKPLGPPRAINKEPDDKQMPDYKAERSTAEWALALPKLEMRELNLQLDDGTIQIVKDAAKLPKANFRIIRLCVAGLPTLTDDDVRTRIGPLSSLQDLLLRNCPQVTNQSLAVVEQLPHLRTLRVDFTGISSSRLPQELQKLSLHSLVVDTKQWGSELQQAIVSSPQLRRLGLVSATDAQLQQLLQIPNLLTLILGGVRAEPATYRQIALQQPQLEVLFLTAAKLADADLECLAGLRRLKELSLSQTSITDAGLPALAALTELKNLALTKTGVTEAGVLKLHTAIPRCRITWDGATLEPTETAQTADALQRRLATEVITVGGRVTIYAPDGSRNVSQLADLPQGPFFVRSVDVAGIAKWTDRQMAALRGIPYAIVLGLSGTPITNDGLAPLAAMTLDGIDLGDSHVTDEGIALLAGNPTLRSFQLPGAANITPETWTRVAAMPRLRSINGINSDAGLAALGHARSLHWIMQLDPAITPEGLKSLCDLPHLRLLGLLNIGNAELLPAVAMIRPLRAVLLNQGMPAAAAERLQTSRPELVVFHPALSSTAAERAAVQWILSAGGTFQGGWYQTGDAPDRVPEKSFVAWNLSFPDDRPPVAGAEALRGLRYLRSVRFPQLDDADGMAEHLATLTSLTDVAIDGGKLTAAGLARLCTLPELEQLTFEEKPLQLHDEDWAPLAKCPWLWNLKLGNSPLGDTGLIYLGQIAQLQILSLTNCPNVTAAGLRGLQSLRWLQILDLAGTRLDDEAVVPLSAIASLRNLNLRRTQVTPAGLARLHTSLPHCAIFHDIGLILPEPLPDAAPTAGAPPPP